MNRPNEWEMTIGLEIHCQVATKSKLFSRTPYRFDAEPNTQISEICTGQPGTLPVLNREAVRKTVLLGCAIGSRVAPFCKFDRKSYFYPDNPRNFQITQYDMPLLIGGSIEALVDGEKRSFSINRAHLEDDTGSMKHFKDCTVVDFNRAGVPLIEIVSDPCFSSAEEASAYAESLKLILEYLEVSHCDMEKGELRFDVNLSVRPKGETHLRTRIEIKNINSFQELRNAIRYEKQRQIDLYLEHWPQEHVFDQETYRWDQVQQKSVKMRAKETASDYRHFTEPNLVPLLISKEEVERTKLEVTSLPLDRLEGYLKMLPLRTGLQLIQKRKLSDFFDEACRHHNSPRAIASWVLVEFQGHLKKKNIWETSILPEEVAFLARAVETHRLSSAQAKEVAEERVHSGLSCMELAEKHPPMMSDEKELIALVHSVAQDCPQAVEDLKGGNERSMKSLMGEAMKRTKGKANPKVLRQCFEQTLLS